MTENQIENGFWVWDKKNVFPPDSITFPTQYNGQTKLNVACEQRQCILLKINILYFIDFQLLRCPFKLSRS
jgi:hypothetical protein